MAYTLTFDEKINGWTSFHSYEPEMMVNLNNDLYSFSDGQIYLHGVDNGIRNNFYGVQYDTEIELVLNDGPSDVKIFKTIEIEGSTGKWDTTITTNLESGNIPKDSYKDKEGMFYDFIKRNAADEVDTKLLSVQGVGVLLSTVGSTYTFKDVPHNISIGDVLYHESAGDYVKVGAITNKNKTSVEVTGALVSVPASSFLFVAKNTVAESYGLKGYYASINLSNSDSTPLELFAVNSEISKSFP
jgi:hypothetical protein